MLSTEVVATGWMSESDFLTGLALIQALPGPLFNFSAYIGTPLLPSFCAAFMYFSHRSGLGCNCRGRCHARTGRRCWWQCEGPSNGPESLLLLNCRHVRPSQREL